MSSPPAIRWPARLKLRDSEGRRWLKVEVGLAGHEPLVLYDTPNVWACRDLSTHLAIDVPLPAYASSHWPPSQHNRWYVRVTDQSDPDETTSPLIQILDFTVAKLNRHDDCLTLGRCSTDVYGAAPADRPKTVPEHGSATVFIQGITTSQYPAFVPFTDYNLTLAKPAGGQVEPGQPLTLSGSFTQAVMTQLPSGGVISEQAPLADREVRLYEADLATACLNLPTQWKLLGGTTTALDGGFSFNPAPTTGWHVYAAAIAAGEDTFQASSGYVLVGVGVDPGLVSILPTLPIDLRSEE